MHLVCTIQKYTPPCCPIKWHGGKHYLAEEIVRLMPPHLIYVEPFLGSGKVLFRRDPNREWFDGHPKAHHKSNGALFAKHQGCSEIVNDIYDELANFRFVLQDDRLFEQFCRKVNFIPFSEAEFQRAAIPGGTDVERAVKFFVRNRMSRQGLGKCFASMMRDRTRSKMADPVSAYLSAIEGLPEVHERLRRVVVLNRDAKDVIEKEDNELTCFYLDPPYVKSTRTATNAYHHEMTDSEHEELLDLILTCKGKFLISGYPNAIYDRRLADWNTKDFVIDNKASGMRTKDKEVERIWMNY